MDSQTCQGGVGLVYGGGERYVNYDEGKRVGAL